MPERHGSGAIERANPDRGSAGFVAVLALTTVAVVAMLALVLMGVTRREPPTFAPTTTPPMPAGDRLIGPVLFTVDATNPDRWRFFSFDQGGIVEGPGPLEWDLAFRRFQVIANGGTGFYGSGGVLDLGETEFASLARVPTDGYVTTVARSDSVNAAIRGWYHYSYLSHLLTPKPRSYAVRTADGRFAKLRFIGYYCPGALPGCVTFEYVYQGAGGEMFRETGRAGPEAGGAE